jgi:hypothetical protein
MASLNSSPSTTTPLLQTQDPVSHIQIQQLTEQIHQLTEHSNQQIQQRTEQVQKLTEDNNQLNKQVHALTEQIPLKRWESVKSKIVATVVIIMGTGSFMKFCIVDPMQSRLDQQKDEITQLEKKPNAKVKPGDLGESVSGQNQNSSLDLLSTLISINRVYLDPVNKSVASALILSKSAKDQLKKFPVKMVALNIEFQPGQDSVKFYIFDDRQNKKSLELLKKEGTGNSDNTNERYYEIAAGSFSNVYPSSISEIRIESHGLKKDRKSTSSFAIKSLAMK